MEVKVRQDQVWSQGYIKGKGFNQFENRGQALGLEMLR